MTNAAEQKRRAAAREERRAKSGQQSVDGDAPDEMLDGNETLPDPGAALRTAASAAIAGAAVGAAQAFARRRRHEPEEVLEKESPEPIDEHDDEEDADERVGATADEPPQAQAQTPEPEPEPQPEPEEPEREEPEPRRPAEPGEVGRIVARAKEQLRELRGMDAESVSSIRRTQDGWRVGLDVVEIRRVPESTDVLGTYEVDLDEDGELITFERTARYYRSEADRR